MVCRAWPSISLERSGSGLSKGGCWPRPIRREHGRVSSGQTALPVTSDLFGREVPRRRPGGQESGAGVARAWRGRGAGDRQFLAWGGAGVARAWCGRGAGISCSPRKAPGGATTTQRRRSPGAAPAGRWAAAALVVVVGGCCCSCWAWRAAAAEVGNGAMGAGKESVCRFPQPAMRPVGWEGAQSEAELGIQHSNGAVAREAAATIPFYLQKKTSQGNLRNPHVFSAFRRTFGAPSPLFRVVFGAFGAILLSIVTTGAEPSQTKPSKTKPSQIKPTKPTQEKSNTR
eukprot:gene8872-biopygen3169